MESNIEKRLSKINSLISKRKRIQIYDFDKWRSTLLDEIYLIFVISYEYSFKVGGIISFNILIL